MTDWRMSQLEKLYRALQAAAGQGITLLEAAQVLGVSKSVYVRGLLDEMVANGWANTGRRENVPHPANIWLLRVDDK